MFTLKKTWILVVVAMALSLAACAKRDSGYKARKNAAGANYINADQSQAADDAAARSGYNTDIMAIMQPQASGSGALSVTSYIKVNSTTYQVVTTHNAAGTISKTQQNFDGAVFEVNGLCSNSQCSPYYLVLNITRNGQQIKQTAMKKHFYYTDANSSQDLIMSLGAGEFLSVQDAITTLSQATVGSEEGEYFRTKAQ